MNRSYSNRSRFKFLASCNRKETFSLFWARVASALARTAPATPRTGSCRGSSVRGSDLGVSDPVPPAGCSRGLSGGVSKKSERVRSCSIKLDMLKLRPPTVNTASPSLFWNTIWVNAGVRFGRTAIKLANGIVSGTEYVSPERKKRSRRFVKQSTPAVPDPTPLPLSPLKNPSSTSRTCSPSSSRLERASRRAFRNETNCQFQTVSRIF